MKIPNLRHFFDEGHERTARIKANILTTFLFRGIYVALNLLLVPLTLNYLNPIKYGIWLTFSSIIVWFDFFDIGLGNGLRNKFAEALSQGDRALARVYVSTTYFILAGLVSVVYFLFLFLRPLLNWPKLLNAPLGMAAELNQMVFFVFTFFCVQFVSKLIGTILSADQRVGITSIFNAISSLISLIVIYILTQIGSGSLPYLAVAMGMTPAVVLSGANIIFFARDYRDFVPNIRFVDFKCALKLAALGVKFFVIQICALMIFSSSNIIIAQVCGPTEVTAYNIVFKYFSIATIGFSFILMPFWSAYTEAFEMRDFMWIKSMTNKLIKIWLALTVGVAGMVITSKLAYRVWIGNGVQISFVLTVLMGVFCVMNAWNSIFVTFLNGSGKITLQLYFGLFVAVINVPCSILLARDLHLGNTGVTLSTCLSLVPCTVLWPVQYRKIVYQKARGLWAR